jgi:hypothetical protein
MMLVEMVDILAGNDIDLVIPVAVEGIEGVYLPTLLLSEVGEVFGDEWLHD